MNSGVSFIILLSFFSILILKLGYIEICFKYCWTIPVLEEHYWKTIEGDGNTSVEAHLEYDQKSSPVANKNLVISEKFCGKTQNRNRKREKKKRPKCPKPAISSVHFVTPKRTRAFW